MALVEPNPEAFVALERAYVQVWSLAERLGDDDRAELVGYAQAFEAFTDDVLAWAAQHDDALADGLGWLRFAATALRLNLETGDPCRHRVVLLVIARGLEQALGERVAVNAKGGRGLVGRVAAVGAQPARGSYRRSTSAMDVGLRGNRGAGPRSSREN